MIIASSIGRVPVICKVSPFKTPQSAARCSLLILFTFLSGSMHESLTIIGIKLFGSSLSSEIYKIAVFFFVKISENPLVKLLGVSPGFKSITAVYCFLPI